MEKSSQLSSKISNHTEVSIMSVGPEFDLNKTIWAINWFDLKYGWLYDFYNKLALPHVKKVGGIPLLKASLIEKLEGSPEDKRQMLLIVSYPNAPGFIEMLQSKVFQLKSILRISAVDKFTFGFMQRFDKADKTNDVHYKGHLKYLVHHYKGEITKEQQSKLPSLAREYDVFTKFIGIKSALIGTKKGNDKLRTAPFMMDGMMVFAAFERRQFDQLLQDPRYRKVVEGTKSNFLGIYKKVF